MKIVNVRNAILRSEPIIFVVSIFFFFIRIDFHMQISHVVLSSAFDFERSIGTFVNCCRVEKEVNGKKGRGDTRTSR